jgi:hypothetical protein
MTHNATFYAFNPSGKWKYEGRGYLSESVFSVFSRAERRAQILMDNDGKFPGMCTSADEYVWVVIGDREINHGYPLMLHPLS